MASGWCKAGAVAKTAEGKLGVVSRHPDSDGEVKLRFADGETSGYTKAGTLTQAAASDDGYEALRQTAKEFELAKAAENNRAEDVQRLLEEGVSADAKDGTRRRH